MFNVMQEITLQCMARRQGKQILKTLRKRGGTRDSAFSSPCSQVGVPVERCRSDGPTPPLSSSWPLAFTELRARIPIQNSSELCGSKVCYSKFKKFPWTRETLQEMGWEGQRRKTLEKRCGSRPRLKVPILGHPSSPVWERLASAPLGVLASKGCGVRWGGS